MIGVSINIQYQAITSALNKILSVKMTKRIKIRITTMAVIIGTFTFIIALNIKWLFEIGD